MRKKRCNFFIGTVYNMDKLSKPKINKNGLELISDEETMVYMLELE